MAIIPKGNLAKASNLMFISAGISVVTLVIYLILSIPISAPSFVGIGLLLILAFFVRAGQDWARYLFALIAILGALVSPFMILALTGIPAALVIYLIQLLMHIYAVILMFKRTDDSYIR